MQYRSDMMQSISLVWLGEGAVPEWLLGDVHCIERTVEAINHLVQQLGALNADAWLLWDSRLLPPKESVISACWHNGADITHAGLRLGMAGKPSLIDAVAPTWMLNRDPL